jgi:transposase
LEAPGHGAAARADVARVGIEATGGDERGVAARRRGADLVVMVLRPLQTKA